MEEKRKEIEELRREIKEKQAELNSLRRRLQELEKEVSKEEIKDVKLSKVSSEVLEEAEDIPIREVCYAINLTEYMRKLQIGGIRNLRDLYDMAFNNRLINIRNIGEKSAIEINSALQDLPGVIERVKQKRKEIKENDTLLQLLIEDKGLLKKLSQMSIHTLEQLYYKDVRSDCGIMTYSLEEKVVNILKLYSSQKD